MATPTIVRVTPNPIRTGGRQLVKVWGSNFRQAPAPPAMGVVPTPNPSVQVSFSNGGPPIYATEVRVLATALLHFLSPIADAGTYTMTVQNVDQDGNVVAGEVATMANFVFARPAIGSSDPTKQSTLSRLVQAAILELRRQILQNVVLATSTDYDDTPDGANIAALAETPGLVLSGPFLRQNRHHARNNQREYTTSEGETYATRAPRTVDVVFTLIGVDDSLERTLDLMNEATTFFERNLQISMLRDPTVPGVYASWEMWMEPDGDFKMQGQANSSNLHSFSGTFSVRGFFIDDADMNTRLLSPVNDLSTDAGGYVTQVPPED